MDVGLALPLMVALIVVALALDFLNGMNDAANSIATVVSTRVLSPQYAVIWAAFFNFIAFMVFGLHVAETVGRGIVEANIIDARIIFGALTGAIVWQVITNRLGIPSSSSHALIGGLVGAGMAKAGLSAAVWGGLTKTLLAIVLSPLVGFLLALVLVAIIVLKVVPAFSDFYVSFGADLPLATRVIVGVSDFVRSQFVVILIVLVGAIALLVSWFRAAGQRARIDRLLLAVPMLGDVARKFATSQMARTLATLLGGGLPLVNALDIAAQSVGMAAFPHLTPGKEVVLAFLPFFHIYGQVVIMLNSLCQGHLLVLFTSPDTEAIIAAMERYQATVFYGVPTLYEYLKDHKDTDKANWKRLKLIVSGADTLHGGSGTDTVDYSAALSPVAVDLDGNADDGGPGEKDRVESDVEKVIGSPFGDHLAAISGTHTLSGGLGDDMLIGGTGADKLLGGPGNDTLNGGVGSDELHGDAGVDMAEIGAVHLAGFEPRLGQVGVEEHRALGLQAVQRRFGEVGQDEGRAHHRGAAQVRPCQVGAGKVRAKE